MSRVRGKKRMEIIKRFLDGDEDPDYEVIPTVTNGKYFVRPRKKKLNINDVNDDNDDEYNDDDKSNDYVNDDDKPKHQHKQLKQVKQSKQQKQIKQPIQDASRQMVHKDLKQVKQREQSSQRAYSPKALCAEHEVHQLKQNTDIYDPTIPYQILEQLKILGEEQMNKRKKKEQKKLVKHQIRKQLSKTKKKESSDNDYDINYDYEVEEEQQPHQITNFLRPVPVRRKVNLIK